jgi:hypothetical protein
MPDLGMEWVQTTASAAGTNSLTYLPKHGGVGGHPSEDLPL